MNDFFERPIFYAAMTRNQRTDYVTVLLQSAINILTDLLLEDLYLSVRVDSAGQLVLSLYRDGLKAKAYYHPAYPKESLESIETALAAVKAKGGKGRV